MKKKKTKNGTFKPLSTISVPCMKIQTLMDMAEMKLKESEVQARAF